MACGVIGKASRMGYLAIPCYREANPVARIAFGIIGNASRMIGLAFLATGKGAEMMLFAALESGAPGDGASVGGDGDPGWRIVFDFPLFEGDDDVPDAFEGEYGLGNVLVGVGFYGGRDLGHGDGEVDGDIGGTVGMEGDGVGGDGGPGFMEAGEAECGGLSDFDLGGYVYPQEEIPSAGLTGADGFFVVLPPLVVIPDH